MIRDIGDSISDVFHEIFGETCPYCSKWYFFKRNAFRCCEHTALAQLDKKWGQEALKKELGERRNGTYWRRSAPLICSTPPPVTHYCSICGNPSIPRTNVISPHRRLFPTPHHPMTKTYHYLRFQALRFELGIFGSRHYS